MSHRKTFISRRHALAWGGGVAGGLVAASSPLLGTPGSAMAARARGGIEGGQHTPPGRLPVQQIENIMQTTGTLRNGVLAIDLERQDLTVTGPHGVPFKPAFELLHEFFFQPLANGQAFLNSEFTFVESEMTRVLDAILANGLTVMSQHQHFIGERPQTWHYHFRGVGDPLKLAQAAINVVRATPTPLPQMPPSNPTTPLPKDQLARILGGTAQVGSDGVVTVGVERADTIVIAGIVVHPDAGVDHTIAFEPLGGGRAACAPDYALIAPEVNSALQTARAVGFEVHCLYNQETDEHPQLYFSHQLATGDPIDLARRVRHVLDTTNTKRA